MGKEKRSVAVTFRNYVHKFGVLITGDELLFCTACEDKMNATKHFLNTQHFNTVMLHNVLL